MSSENFSYRYRSELVSELLSIEDHKSRRLHLNRAKKTLDYQLAMGEKLATQRGETYVSNQILGQKEFQQRLDSGYHDYYMSNEPCLYKLFPVIKEKTDAIVALGSDQGFDLFVNSQASHLFMVDITEPTSLLTRTLLEIGSRHKKTFGHYPNPNEFIEYFNIENIFHISRFLEKNLTSDEIFRVLRLIKKPNNEFSPESTYHIYLQYKKIATNDKNENFSWNSTSSNLEKIFTAYDEGKIFILSGNICSPKTIENIKNISQSLNCSIGTIYLSNAEEYSDFQINYRQNIKNVMALPFSKNAVLLRTRRYGETTHIENKKVLKFKEENEISLLPWHYNAQTIKSIKRNETETLLDFSNKIDRLCEKKSFKHPKKGVSLIGFGRNFKIK